MIRIRVRATAAYLDIKEWMFNNDIDGLDYSMEMAGMELTPAGDIEFYPEYSFEEHLDSRLLTEFALRFS